MLEEQRLLDDSAGSLESGQQVVELIISWRWRPHASGMPAPQGSADELFPAYHRKYALSMRQGLVIEVAFDERHTADGRRPFEFRAS